MPFQLMHEKSKRLNADAAKDEGPKREKKAVEKKVDEKPQRRPRGLTIESALARVQEDKWELAATENYVLNNDGRSDRLDPAHLKPEGPDSSAVIKDITHRLGNALMHDALKYVSSYQTLFGTTYFQGGGRLSPFAASDGGDHSRHSRSCTCQKCIRVKVETAAEEAYKTCYHGSHDLLKPKDKKEHKVEFANDDQQKDHHKHRVQKEMQPAEQVSPDDKKERAEVKPKSEEKPQDIHNKHHHHRRRQHDTCPARRVSRAREKERTEHHKPRKPQPHTHLTNVPRPEAAPPPGPPQAENTKSLLPDYYAILALDKSASDDDIKKAYRVLSLKHHSDRNRDNEEATRKFQAISEAYVCLGDEATRAKYDVKRAVGAVALGDRGDNEDESSEEVMRMGLCGGQALTYLCMSLL